MQKTRINRPFWLNLYRIVSTLALASIAVMCVILLNRSFTPIDTIQATKVERATSFLEDAGFANPIYLDITKGVEGEYPTFRATAIGGKSVDLWIRTTPNGGWEIQPVGVFRTVASADDFARMAQDAVYNWEKMSPDIKPRTDGSYGEYESRKYDYDRLAKYAPDASYWQTRGDETNGWPRK